MLKSRLGEIRKTRDRESSAGKGWKEGEGVGRGGKFIGARDDSISFRYRARKFVITAANDLSFAINLIILQSFHLHHRDISSLTQFINFHFCFLKT